MSTFGQHRTRAQRVAAKVHYNGLIDRLRYTVLIDHGLLKIGLLLLISVIMGLLIHAWNPPFTYKIFGRIERDIVCKTPFSVPSFDKTKEARQLAKLEALHVYAHDPTKLNLFKAGLVNTVQSLLSVDSYPQMNDELKGSWKNFLPATATDEDAERSFQLFHDIFEPDAELAQFKQALDQIFLPGEKNGVLSKLHGYLEGNQDRISVYEVSGPSDQTPREFPVNEVLLGNAMGIKDRIDQFYDRNVAALLFAWIRPRIPATLTEDRDATARAKEVAAGKVEMVYSNYEPGQTIAKGGALIDLETFRLLQEEHQNMLAARGAHLQLIRFIGAFIMIFIMLFLSYFFMQTRLREFSPTGTLKPFLIIYGLILLTVLVGEMLQVFLGNQGANPELIPILIFAQLVAIAFCWDIAIFTGFVTAFVLALSCNMELGTFLVLVGTISVVVVASRNVRTRGRIIYVALVGSIIAFLSTLAIGLIREQLLDGRLFYESLLRMIWTLLAGFLFAGLLPFLERAFGILTPMRLVEIGNPSHPLLQELSRRAPATYNLSIQTASIAEAAAEAIGARAALVRVGAYFHDIGKLLNPGAFTENQPPGSANIHDSLEPRVSTLVIVAHVKDGIDLARQYHLPQQVIDLIEQHHGTMLVGFFYEQANEISKKGDRKHDLEESSFHYPGPIPQSKEAGILMLADAIESACRSLGDDIPPGRIENLVRSLTEKRMERGQFDESGLTLGEIRTIGNSMINSILAGRHHRIKYPTPKEGKPA